MKKVKKKKKFNEVKKKKCCELVRAHLFKKYFSITFNITILAFLVKKKEYAKLSYVLSVKFHLNFIYIYLQIS